MRFLTDYLQGDIYFKTHHEGHNLERCRNQFAYVKSIESKLPEMEDIVGRNRRTRIKRSPRRMKILITGGAGFIGSHIVELYQEKAEEIRVLDNLRTGYRHNLEGPETHFHRRLDHRSQTCEKSRRGSGLHLPPRRPCQRPGINGQSRRVRRYQCPRSAQYSRRGVRRRSEKARLWHPPPLSMATIPSSRKPRG